MQVNRCPADRIDGCMVASTAYWEGRGRAALQALKPWGGKLFCLKLTKKGHPQHPLYVKADTEPVRFEP